MSGKLKLNSNAGGSVKFKVNDALATDEELELDHTGNYGIESGSNVNGNWVKFPDGTLICRHAKTFFGVAINIANGVLYRSASTAAEIVFPYIFVGDNPKVDISPRQIIAVISINPYNLTLTGTGTLVNSVNSLASQDVIINYIAIGRWK